MDDVEAGPQLEELADHMRRRADPRCRIGELAGIGLAIGDELADRLHRQRRVDDHDVRIVVEMAVDGRVDAERRGVGEHQRVAVGFRRRGTTRPYGAAGAAAILDDDVLAEHHAQLLAQNAPDHIGRTAGRKGHDELDRPHRIEAGETGWRLCASGLHAGERREHKGKSAHHHLPPLKEMAGASPGHQEECGRCGVAGLRKTPDRPFAMLRDQDPCYWAKQ
jgi:hypothetical protein